jgi:hypothetical protein
MYDNTTLVDEIRVDTIGEGRYKQAKATITYRFGDAVTCTGRGSWLLPG